MGKVEAKEYSCCMTEYIRRVGRQQCQSRSSVTFKSLAGKGEVHAQLARQAGQEVGRSNVCEEADPAFRHGEHGPVRDVTIKVSTQLIGGAPGVFG